MGETNDLANKLKVRFVSSTSFPYCNNLVVNYIIVLERSGHKFGHNSC